MTDDNWKTLRVPADKYQEAKAQKEADDRTWGEQIVRPDGDESDGAGIPDDLRAQLDRIESSAATAEERAGRIESTLEGLQR